MVTIRPRPCNPAAPASLIFPSCGRPADVVRVSLDAGRNTPSIRAATAGWLGVLVDVDPLGDVAVGMTQLRGEDAESPERHV